MSSEFERLLREARSSLPESSDEAAERARVRALEAAGARQPRRRPVLLAGLAVVVALVLGVGIGASRAPGVTAAPGAPSGFGFLPVNGWYVVQNGGLATPEHPAIATAANVPIQPGDGASILPYATLQLLPADGVVLVASIVAQGASLPLEIDPRRAFDLPLRVSTATTIQYGAQIRPERPLGQYQIRANVKGYSVDVHLYFGTTEPTAETLQEAQRQLDRLVLRLEPGEAPTAARPSGDLEPSRAAQAVTLRVVRVFDRASNWHRLRFSGRISATREGEYVAVLRQRCGTSFGTAVAGAQTQAGGFWEAETTFSPPPGRESASYWARWNDSESTRVQFRGRLFVNLDALGRGRFRATVQPAEAPQQLAGRTILLQRRTSGGWVRVRSSRLRPDASIPGASFAAFTYPQRRHELRALVPRTSAGPCFLASPSDSVKS